MSDGSKPNYSPGLEGVIAGESAIGLVDSDSGLFYRGYDVHDLAKQATFEHVAYLLLQGELPDTMQLTDFRRQLAVDRPLPAALVEVLRLQPRSTVLMDSLRTGASMLGAFDPDLNDLSHEANLRKGTRLVARLSMIAATASRLAAGHPAVAPRDDLGFAENFLFVLEGREPEAWRVKVIDTLSILYAEHDFNASTFAARVTCSTLADMYAGVTAALAALKGPLHGGANEEAMKMFHELESAHDVAAWVRDRLARKQKIMGFGHRVYKKGDKRADVMREMARQIGEHVGQPQWAKAGESLEKVMLEEKNLYANADLYAAPLFHMLGISESLNTPVFAAARVAGWAAHITEQQDHNRLIRPRSWYTGPRPRPLPA
ncbi:MAG: citrate synthase [Phycisphaerae bacterium]|nr:citrate synthase [Phycisphaerae bacterium]